MYLMLCMCVLPWFNKWMNEVKKENRTGSLEFYCSQPVFSASAAHTGKQGVKMNMSWGRDGRDWVGVMTVLPPHKSQKNSAAHSHGALQFTSFLTHRGSADWRTDHVPLSKILLESTFSMMYMWIKDFALEVWDEGPSLTSPHLPAAKSLHHNP